MGKQLRASGGKRGTKWKICYGCKEIAPTVYEMEIFLGACSGVDLGNVTVRTPFSIDALISSS